jgi:putative hydrolase of the HAD superfamily
MDKTPVLIFDLGSVVLTNDHPFHTANQAKEFCSYYNIDLDEWLRGWDSSWPDFRIGKITEDEFWKKLLTFSMTDKIDIEFAKKFWRDNQRPIEGMFDLLDRLKKSYKMAALSTISKEWLDFKREKFELDKYFDLIISSGYSGLKKPYPPIYHLIIKKLKENPQNCIFIDDLDINLATARDLGMKTILFGERKTFQNDLHSLGIEF